MDNNFFWSAIDIEVLRDNKISQTARLIFAIVCTFANVENRNAYPSNRKVANMAGVSVRTVSRAYSELASVGIILREERFRAGGLQTSSNTLLVGHNAERYKEAVSNLQYDTHDTPAMTPVSYHELHHNNDIKESLQGKPDLPNEIPPEEIHPEDSQDSNQDSKDSSLTEDSQSPEESSIREDRYSPEDSSVPDIMRPTARYLLDRTGRKFLKWKDVSALRELAASQVPARVQKEIDTACERFRRNGHDVGTLTFCYIADSLRHQPTYGRKAKILRQKRKANSQHITQAEITAVQPEINPDDLDAELARAEEELKRLGGYSLCR